MYGWDQDREEKLRELKKLIQHSIFVKKWRQAEVIEKYYEYIVQGRENEIKKVTDIAPNGAHYEDYDDSIGKLKTGIVSSLKKYYATKEGKQAKYRIFFATHLHLGIEEKREQKKPMVSPGKAINIKNINLAKTKEGTLNFLEIYPDAWFKPKNIVSRSITGTFNWNALGFHICSLLIVISIFYIYFDVLHIPSNYSGELKQQTLSIVFSIKILFQIIVTPLITMFLWFIYTYKVKKNSPGYLETLNFQFYFLSAWLPLIVLLSLALIKSSLYRSDATLLSVIIYIVLGCMIYKYFQGINELFGLQGKKRFFKFVCYMGAFIAYGKLLF